MNGRVIPAGTVFKFLSGDYDDCTVLNIFRALVDVDIDKMREEWLAANPRQRELYNFRSSQFFGDLAKRRIIEEVPSMDFWICSTHGKFHLSY